METLLITLLLCYAGSPAGHPGGGHPGTPHQPHQHYSQPHHQQPHHEQPHQEEHHEQPHQEEHHEEHHETPHEEHHEVHQAHDIHHDVHAEHHEPNRHLVDHLRHVPRGYCSPEARRVRMEHHFEHWHYPHPYAWYCGRPFFYVGGGYSCVFWWMVLDWDVERRALWFYNNYGVISDEAYQQGLADGEVKAKIDQWETEGKVRDSNYVDPEFQDSPSDMYDDSYVNNLSESPNENRTLKYVSVGCLILSTLATIVLVWRKWRSN